MNSNNRNDNIFRRTARRLVEWFDGVGVGVGMGRETWAGMGMRMRPGCASGI